MTKKIILFGFSATMLIITVALGIHFAKETFASVFWLCSGFFTMMLVKSVSVLTRDDA